MITGTYLPSANGVAVAVAQLKSSLEGRGHDVYLFAPDNKRRPKRKEKNVYYYPSVDNPIHKDYPIPLLPINSFLINKLPKIKPDLVHVHHAYYIGYFAKLIADYFKVPLVFTYHSNHDVYAKKYVGFLPKGLQDKFLNNRVYDFCKTADLVISPAEHTTTKLKNKDKNIVLTTIPSAVSLHSTKTKKKKNRNKLAGKYIILSISRLSSEKNLDLVIKSLVYLPDKYQLLVAGTGPDLNSLKKLSVKLNLRKRIKFLGKIEHGILGEYYSSADVFAFASDSETQGLVYLEAMNFNLPIVAVESKAAREWVFRGLGKICKKDSKSIAESILELEKEGFKMDSKTANKIVSKFSPNKVVLKMEEAYKNVIKKNKIPQRKSVVSKLKNYFPVEGV